MIDVPVEVRRKAASQGAAGVRWLHDLPRVVESLERDWDVVAGAALRGDWATHQIETLRLAAGRGYVRLLARDEQRRARPAGPGPDRDRLRLAVPMREWSRELLEGDTLRAGRERCARLSRLTGADRQPIWEWGFVERVSTGLLALHTGRERLGREMLEVAEAFAQP